MNLQVESYLHILLQGEEGWNLPSNAMLINLGKLSTNDEVIVNTDNITRIYKKDVNLSNFSTHPYKYSLYMNDGKNLEISLNAKDNQVFRALLEKFDYTDSDMGAPIIKLF